MTQVSEAFAVLQALYRFTQAQDRLDLATMASILVPDRKIKFDLSKHFAEVGVVEGSASEICNILYEASAGWTATQHPMYNPVVTIEDDNPTNAHVVALVSAYHCLEREGQVEGLTVRAFWHVWMEKRDKSWLINEMSMERDVPIANQALFQEAQAWSNAGHKRQPSSRPPL